MKIRIYFPLLLASLAFAGLAKAESGVFGSYLGLNINGGGNTFYGGDQPGPNLLQPLAGADLGDFNPSGGDSLLISGAEMLTFKNGGSNVTGGDLYWRVNQLAPVAVGGVYTILDIGFTADAPFNDAASNTFSTVGDQKWAQIASTPDVLAGLGPGAYSLEVFYVAGTDGGERFSPASGGTFAANFSVIPEPTTAALIGLAAVGLLATRRR